jgi:hypothetical protein
VYVKFRFRYRSAEFPEAKAEGNFSGDATETFARTSEAWDGGARRLGLRQENEF